MICLLIDCLIDCVQVVGETVRFLMQPMATIFAGHLGETELNAVALANSVNITVTLTICEYNYYIINFPMIMTVIVTSV